MKNIAVLVSGGGTNLQALIDAQKEGKIKNGEIVLVISSSPDAYALTRAKENHIPTLVLDRKEFNSNREYTKGLLEALKGNNIDLIVLAGFMTILTDDLIDQYPNAIINVHPALIPSFCGEGFFGLKVHEKALEYGVKVSGATVHFVNSECDGGPIILQKAIDVLEDDTPEILQKRIMENCEWILLPQAVSLFCDNRLKVNNRQVQIVDSESTV